jgi:hypothetical protein
MTHRPSTDAPVTIRLGVTEDGQALVALALLDSARALNWPVLVAEDGELRAAISLADGAVIADPFHPTAELVELLRTRARQLSLGREPTRRARWRWLAPRRRAAHTGLRLQG